MINARIRPLIESITPCIDDGRYAIKRVRNEDVGVRAVILSDGHDQLNARIIFRALSSTEERALPTDWSAYRSPSTAVWYNAPLEPDVNDEWVGRFKLESEGLFVFTVEAWVDHFRTWRTDIRKKFAAGQDVQVDMRAGIQMIQAARDRARAAGHEHNVATLDGYARELEIALRPALNQADVDFATGLEIYTIMEEYSDRSLAARFDREQFVRVDRPLAGCSAWYELFPRSAARRPDRHGTFQDVVDRLPRIAEMGFDIVYLPPIHPIGHTFRKGPNNSLHPEPDDPGSPWAIGSEQGGHKSIHPELGDFDGFADLVRETNRLGMEIALDIAFQCSPDHPYVREHPEWFRKRADGSIQYAENPPKKYQDIYPLDFETTDPDGLWRELKSIFEFWIERGVKVFRVDNPHTKSFPFWKWALRSLKCDHPDVIFLAEAFTRPHLMYHLAKIGFTQSYTYFTWRNNAHDMRDYLTELTTTSVRDFYRPNFWPNTPDILHADLQTGGRAAFEMRLVLAATLSPNYGVYGPAFELCVNTPREEGSEEYLDSEKYQIQNWDLQGPVNLTPLITHINRLRREHRALQSNASLRFYESNNPNILAYSKHGTDPDDVLLMVVNMDPHHTQKAMIDFACQDLGIDPTRPYTLRDEISGKTFTWQDCWNYVELNPHLSPVHIFTVSQTAPRQGRYA